MPSRTLLFRCSCLFLGGVAVAAFQSLWAAILASLFAH
jgi:hypothetical protein